MLLYVFFPNTNTRSIYCCATLFAVLPLCSCVCNVISRLSITQYSLFHAACFFLLSVSSSPLCRYLCFCICASLLHFLSSHPLPTHTLSVLVLWAVYMCTEALETTFFSFFSSHLAALYSNYPRRGLTAGNINRTACSDIEHTLMHNLHTHTHTCKRTTLIVLTEPWPTTQCTPVIHLFMTHYYVSHPADAFILMGL